ncbi:MAG: propionyl-CoA synthetase [Marmoricola sp.]|nr:propionyl-CoA synthetase [Marmoricola sp.]
MSTPPPPATRVNVTFTLLDRAVVTGRADEPVLPGWTHARLLEEVAALGGVLHHLGVSPGVPVRVDLEAEADAVVAALATARIGGVVHAAAASPAATGEQVGPAPVVLASAGSASADGPAPAGVVRLVRHARDSGQGAGPAGGQDPEQDLEWGAMIRAGRTDPAACLLVGADAAYAPGRTVAEVLADLRTSPPPYAAGELRRLLGV